MGKGMLFVISGPSGSGKDSIRRRLDKSKFELSISTTTRTPRANEIDGTDYFFVTKEKFAEMLAKNELLEHNDFCGDYYGTPKNYVEQRLNDGKNVILEIDVNGAVQVKELYGDAILIFIMAPSVAELKNRLLKRNLDTLEKIEQRVERAVYEIGFIDRYDYLIINSDLEKALKSFNAITEAERLRTSRRKIEFSI